MPTFPALDEEPPPRPVSQVLVMAAVGAVVVAAIVVAAVVRPWPSGAHGGAAPAAAGPMRMQGVGGRILVLDYKTGRFGYTSPDGNGFTPLNGGTATGRFAQVSPDGSMAVTDSGLLVRFSQHRATVSSAEPPAQQNTLMPTSLPWADHGQRLVLMTVGGGHAEVSTVDLNGRNVHALGGGANDAVGDPTGDGALVMVAGHKLVNMGGYSELPTVRLELRTPEHQQLLATTADLARRIGLPSEVPYRVSAQFSADGRYIAVSLDQLGHGTATGNGQVTLSQSAEHGLIVLRRNGSRVVAARSRASVRAAWSHDGHRLATVGLEHGAIVIFDVTHPRSNERTFGVRDGLLSGCLWSPREDYLACDDYQAAKRFILNVAKARALGPLPLRPKDRYALVWQPGKAA